MNREAVTKRLGMSNMFFSVWTSITKQHGPQRQTTPTPIPNLIDVDRIVPNPFCSLEVPE